jgi:hypothetical protein
VSEIDEIERHESTWRESTSYPATRPRRDPGGSPTTDWPVIVTLLLLVPPLGWLQLARRDDVEPLLRTGIAFVALLLVVAAWVGSLRLLR